MRLGQVRDADLCGRVVAEMPLFVWWLTGKTGLLGGFIIESYKWEYEKQQAGLPHLGWFATLCDGVKCWWGCKPLKGADND